MTGSIGARRALASAAWLALAGAVLPASAEAHLVTTGLGPVYDGIGHLLLSPDDLLSALAMALLAGLNGPAAGRRTLVVLTGAWLVGGVAGYLAAAPAMPGMLATASFLVLGVLIAADRPLPSFVVAGLAVAVGSLHGWLNGAALAVGQQDALALAGIACALFVLVALAAAFVVSLRAAWARIAVRVVGSWIAATGLLMLGWWLRGA